MKKFECIPGCGKCCENLRTRINEEWVRDQEATSELMRGRGIYYLTSLENQSIPLFEWEKDLLEERAKDLDFVFSALPLAVVKDGLTDSYLGIEWNMNHNNCPFLARDMKCRIYSERPLACRTFPVMCVQSRPIVFEGIGWDWCPGCSELPKVIVGRAFREVFGSTAIAAMNQKEFSELFQLMMMEARGKNEFLPIVGLSVAGIEQDLQDGSEVTGLIHHLSDRGTLRWADFEQVLHDVYTHDIRLFGSILERMGHLSGTEGTPSR